MKKTFLALAATAILVVSCKKDDDGDDNACKSIDVCGLSTVKVCDNGDGTSTVTAAGEEQIVEMEFTKAVEAQEATAELLCGDGGGLFE